MCPQRRRIFHLLKITHLIFIMIIIIACGGGGGSSSSDNDSNKDDSETSEAVKTVVIPEIGWSYDGGLKTPVTDLADCIDSILDCIENGTELADCFGSEVAICTGEEPSNNCCSQECSDQVNLKLAANSSEHEAFLEVFIYDGRCMPNITEAGYR